MTDTVNVAMRQKTLIECLVYEHIFWTSIEQQFWHELDVNLMRKLGSVWTQHYAGLVNAVWSTFPVGKTCCNLNSFLLALLESLNVSLSPPPICCSNFSSFLLLPFLVSALNAGLSVVQLGHTHRLGCLCAKWTQETFILLFSLSTMCYCREATLLHRPFLLYAAGTKNFTLTGVIWAVKWLRLSVQELRGKKLTK